MRKATIVTFYLAYYSATLIAQTGTWTQLSPPVNPPKRGNAAMAYDAGRKEVVLFGGSGNNGHMNDTWLWNGFTWRLVTPPLSPSPRVFQQNAMVYDGHNIVLYGGHNLYGEFLRETWLWDGITWKDVTASAGAPPVAVGQGSVAFDAKNEQTVFYGAAGGSSETWTFNGTIWQKKLTAHHPPGSRYDSAMVYDKKQENIVLFGGGSDGRYTNDTWIWDGSDWAEQTPITSPPARLAHGMAYDGVNGNVVLFGGLGMNNAPPLDDTWVWDGANWTAQTLGSADHPSARVRPLMSFDETRQHVVLFGGSNYGGQNDTWVWPTPGVNTEKKLVVLIHGFCSDPSTFGQMKTFLQEDVRVPVLTYDYSKWTKDLVEGPSIAHLAQDFGTRIRTLLQHDPQAQIDVVAHSMGALIARTWISGIAGEYSGQIRRLVMLGAPNYGSGISIPHPTCSSVQFHELQYGSWFIERLHDAWYNGPYSTPKPDILAIAGVDFCLTGNCSDGVVHVQSAVLPDSLNIRYVNYSHIAMQTIQDKNHESYRLTKQFLSEGTVLPQCCGDSSVNYTPSFLTGKPLAEGFVVLRLKDAESGKTIRTLAGSTSLCYGVENTFFGCTSGNWNAMGGTFTALQLPAPNPYSFLINVLGYNIKATSPILVQRLRPTVPPPITLKKRQ